MSYYVFIDIDGTLLDNSTNSIPSSAIKAISQAKRNGHKIFICTGRSFPSVTENFLKLDIDGVIAGCGGQIIIEGKQIYFCPMPKNMIEPVVDYFISKDIGFMLEGEEKNYLYSAKNSSNIEKKLCDFLYTDGLFVPFIHSQVNYEKIIKISFFTLKKDDVDIILSKLGEDYYSHYDDWYPGVFTGEILYTKNTKASGIDFIIKRDNHPLEKVIAIGDSMNDYDMIMHAGVGIAMGNANQKLKEAADYVTTAVDEDGLYNSFKKYGLI
ncbi:MAG: Cof-type HAD-IIB family hydrolase [Erysipelotrichaceae bacterium]|jgi:Cof subfamily protein (haloacid dehalogenase superfamily)